MQQITLNLATQTNIHFHKRSMADLTLSAVDSLLSLIGRAIKDEVKLLSGVKGDIQFIKDEMDSMNGFLLHLTKTETEHNDQHRAWMKQVRDISYIAQDCIRLYLRELAPPATGGRCATVGHILKVLWTCKGKKYDQLARDIRELKDRVREVGERRLRYGVSVPEATPKPEPIDKDDGYADEKREEFLRALEKAELGHVSSTDAGSFDTAISLLPDGDLSETVKEIGKILKKHAAHHVDSMKMLLRALYAHPHATKEELEKLKKKLEGRPDVRCRWEVMVFCYSKLSTHYKICLQYLTAFLAETSVSRTSLVRRWVAEDHVVARDEGRETLEEAGECCFDELVLRGFVRPATPVVRGLKIKSCYMEKSVRDFVIDISKSENFVSVDLPTHLRYQVDIRKIAQRQPPKEPQQMPKCPWNICPRKPPLQDDDDNSMTAAEDKVHPMDQMVRLLKGLPKGYRLNVLDLGGCRGMKNCHLKIICKCNLVCLKYLSLRNTEVSWLPKEINDLQQLETLDIRQTNMQATATAHIDLPNLKNLLAGNLTGDETDQTLSAVQVPHKLGTSMEILRHVQVMRGQAELHQLVGHLKKLRKLGVILEVESRDDNNIHHLLRIINLECLRSLSVCITLRQSSKASDEGDMEEAFSPRNYLESLNIRGSGITIIKKALLTQIKVFKRLSKITLRDTRLTSNDLQTLGELESLCCLRLHRGSYTDDIRLERGFQRLRFFLIDLEIEEIKFDFRPDAAPKLEKIYWVLHEKTIITADTFLGVTNLESLEELEIHSDDDLGFDQWNHVKQVLSNHKKQPLLTCSLRNSDSNGDFKVITEVSVIGK